MNRTHLLPKIFCMAVGTSRLDIYDQPAYRVPEAARLLVVPLSTVRAWSFGQRHASGDASRRYKPLIAPADPRARLLSFLNLCELHMLAAIRRTHSVPMPAVREALKYVARELGTERPLLSADFLTNGLSLFIQHAPLVVDASRDGQVEFDREFVADLSRVARDDSGNIVRLFPVTRLTSARSEVGRVVMIDPRISFGRPVLARGGISTEVIQDRFLAGDSPEEMAADFGVPHADILEALRFEHRIAA